MNAVTVGGLESCLRGRIEDEFEEEDEDDSMPESAWTLLREEEKEEDAELQSPRPRTLRHPRNLRMNAVTLGGLESCLRGRIEDEFEEEDEDDSMPESAWTLLREEE